MWGDALAVAAKDLRVEWRSRVALGQVAPFAVLMLVLFAFAVDADGQALARLAPGVFWVAVLFSSVMVVQRSWLPEVEAGVGDALRLAGLHPAGFFLGKAMAVLVQLLALEVVLLGGVALMYRVRWTDPGLIAATLMPATAGIAAVGALYGQLSSSLRTRDSLFPLLVLPVLAPVLIGATRTFERAVGVGPADGAWGWVALLSLFGVSYWVLGALVARSLLEDA